MEYIKLNHEVSIPMMGYGTLHISPEMTEQCVLDAIDVGYRLIDTAAAYLNEKEVGLAIKKTSVPREELFVTTKVWIQDSGYEHTIKAFYSSLEALGLDYLDLYLIHHPYGDCYGSWRAMEDLYNEGKVRAIGVCNFSMDRFVDLSMNCAIKPMINQIEYHPFFQQKESYSLLKKYHCQLQAWGPLNEGQRDIFHHQVLSEIAQKHQKTAAQIVLRWHIETGVVTIPKTVHRNRMIENMDVWNFQLDEEDHTQIAKLDIGFSEIIDHRSYRTAERLNTWKIHEERSI